jgi:hypothetical protein
MISREERKIKLEKSADKATKWIGSTSSLFVHSVIFIFSFIIPYSGIISFERMLLVLTTLVSLEAIYLAIFIQMSVNKNSQDIEIIQEDVGEIQEDIEEIEEDIGEIQEESVMELVTERKESEILVSIQFMLLKLQDEIELLKKK